MTGRWPRYNTGCSFKDKYNRKFVWGNKTGRYSRVAADLGWPLRHFWLYSEYLAQFFNVIIRAVLWLMQTYRRLSILCYALKPETVNGAFQNRLSRHFSFKWINVVWAQWHLWLSKYPAKSGGSKISEQSIVKVVFLSCYFNSNTINIFTINNKINICNLIYLMVNCRSTET